MTDEYRLYRGIGGISSVDFGTPVATAPAGAGSKTFTGLGHAPATRYTYVLRPVREDAGGNPIETPDFDCVVEFETDDSGGWVGNRPAKVEVLDAEVIDGAKIMLRWQYRTPQGVIAPSDFGVYYDDCPHISTGSPNTTVNYTRDGQYTTTLSLADASTYYFAVTARTAEGIESHLCPVVGPIVADGPTPNQPTVFTERTFY